MGIRPTSRPVLRAAADIGQQLTTWRKLLGLTAEQVADRGGISRDTLRRIEHGDPGVNFAAVLSVARGLGVLDAIVTATDPYETDLGRARADQT
ncbi:helix-turn-helix domain-containing protein [Tersicoccus phoenicis]|uniref:helix-turn-helix domain-containing protein n=1 Tax=Tersicoccus phoenicis TaxID=554083 RepID=UPI001F1980D9|nr:helix-turn-helix transcriptional regulator [Tersicoccus phoenicis]